MVTWVCRGHGRHPPVCLILGVIVACGRLQFPSDRRPVAPPATQGNDATTYFSPFCNTSERPTGTSVSVRPRASLIDEGVNIVMRVTRGRIITAVTNMSYAAAQRFP